MSKRKYFGTDGIRGMANRSPMTGEMAMALGRAVTHYFHTKNRPGQRIPMIVIGKDTRRSCYMLEQAFSAGVCSQGGRAILTGPLPTPGVAFVTKSMRADAGIMISASHNPFYDNGIKIFDSNGNKLPDEVELELEAYLDNPQQLERKTHGDLGNAKRLDEVIGRYIVHVKSCFSPEHSLEGMRIVVDSANGAAYRCGPMIFEELGAEVIQIGTNPNGVNINDHCGAMFPEACSEAVLKYRADLGVCLDGDADRIVLVDEKGKVIPGDSLLGLLARYLKDTGKLGSNKMVGTVMTNGGLEKYLKTFKINLVRSQVGDRYILDKMGDQKIELGGEPSGHIIFGDFATTGDGILGALKVIEAIRHYKMSLSEVRSQIPLFPQVTESVEVGQKPKLEEVEAIQKSVTQVEKDLKGTGRVLLRYSGTEPKARVMVEGEDAELVAQSCQKIKEVIARELN